MELGLLLLAVAIGWYLADKSPGEIFAGCLFYGAWLLFVVLMVFPATWVGEQAGLWIAGLVTWIVLAFVLPVSLLKRLPQRSTPPPEGPVTMRYFQGSDVHHHHYYDNRSLHVHYHESDMTDGSRRLNPEPPGALEAPWAPLEGSSREAALWTQGAAASPAEGDGIAVRLRVANRGPTLTSTYLVADLLWRGQSVGRSAAWVEGPPAGATLPVELWGPGPLPEHDRIAVRVAEFVA